MESPWNDVSMLYFRNYNWDVPLCDLLHQRWACTPTNRFKSWFFVTRWFYRPRIVISGLSNLGFHLTDIQDDILRLMSQDRQQLSSWKHEASKRTNLIVHAFDIIESDALESIRQRFKPFHRCRWPSESKSELFSPRHECHTFITQSGMKGAMIIYSQNIENCSLHYKIWVTRGCQSHSEAVSNF